MRKVTATGQTVEEAIQSALEQLALDRDQVEVEVIDEGKKGFLGIFGSSNAVVEVREKGYEEQVVEETTSKVEVKDEVPKDINEKEQVIEKEEINIEERIEEVKQYIYTIAKELDVDIEIKVETLDKQVKYELIGEKIAILIGKRGKTLNALQYLAQLTLNKNGGTYRTVVVDAEGYRERRKETLIQLGNRMADMAIERNRKVFLDPMPAYERKIIHSALQERRDVETESEGREPNRYIVIKKK
ncbi:MAG TPA: RNA-binding cell elongation regulator Jag/EloR [Pseudogracilibacillus sp.]|nr:RNA-binding cell elongation regulator Jag/EloR [Pseudogracilibacillus sp.]